jgi:hypothetical protein
VVFVRIKSKNNIFTETNNKKNDIFTYIKNILIYNPTLTKIHTKLIMPPEFSRENHCLNQTKPEEGSKPTYPGVDIVESVLSNMKNKVYWLDITLQTQLRIDGHPSIYTGRGTSYEDCSHWCLAGAPDTWNEILYAVLLGN